MANKSTDNLRLLNFKGSKNSLGNRLILNTFDLDHYGYQIIREYGTDIYQFEWDLDQVSGGKLYFSDRVGSICHQFSILPESDHLFEQLSCGGFHSDFMFQQEPPAYIALLCLKPDPRHPFFGRNQIVHLKNFLQQMQEIFGVTEDELKQYKLPYSIPGYGILEKPVLDDFQGKSIFRYHESLLDIGKIKKGQLLSGLSLSAAFHAVFMDVAVDICLDQGDMLILSNHHALHRRSECSLSYDKKNGIWDSRELASIRFNL